MILTPRDCIEHLDQMSEHGRPYPDLELVEEIYHEEFVVVLPHLAQYF